MAELDAILSSSPDLSPIHVSPPAEKVNEKVTLSTHDDLNLRPTEDREGKLGFAFFVTFKKCSKKVEGASKILFYMRVK